MSAPKTNLEKQRRRHAAPLIGMGAVVLFGFGVIVLLLFRQVERAPGDVSSPAEGGAVESGVPGGTAAPPPTGRESQAAD